MLFHVKAPIPALLTYVDILRRLPISSMLSLFGHSKHYVSAVTDPERGETGLRQPTPGKEVRKL